MLSNPSMPVPSANTSRSAMTAPYAVHTLFSPDIQLSAQLYQPRAQASQHSGVTGLMQAVFEDALECFQLQFHSDKPHHQRLAREAEAWFLATDDDYLFSFENICSVLGLETTSIRRRLAAWRQLPPPTLQKRRRRYGRKVPSCGLAA